MATAEADEVTLDEVVSPAGALAGISGRSAAIHLRHFLNVVDIKLVGHDGDNELVFNHEWHDPVMAVFLDTILYDHGEPPFGSPHWLLEQCLGMKIVYREPRMSGARWPAKGSSLTIFRNELPPGDTREVRITHHATDAVLLAT